jgi:hypothetical protein
VDPGARLTFSIRDEVRRVEAETGRRPAAIFMQSHGLIAHSDDPDECLRIHTDVNDRIARAFGLENGCFPKVGVREIEGGLVEADCPFLTEQLASGDYSVNLNVTYEDAMGVQYSESRTAAFFAQEEPTYDDPYYPPYYEDPYEPTYDDPGLTLQTIMEMLPWWIYGMGGAILTLMIVLMGLSARSRRRKALEDDEMD